MKDSNVNLSRRKVLAGIASTVAAGMAPHILADPKIKSRVVRVESDRVWKGEKRDPKVVQEMVHSGLIELTDKKTLEAAWKSIFNPDMKVGLKINLLGNPSIYTAPEITAVVAAGAVAAGVKPDNIIIWDRYKDHFLQTEYKLGKHESGGTVCAGGEYDAERLVNTIKSQARMDKLASQATQITINLPVLKDHICAGVTASLKNIAFGCYKHPELAHENFCDPYIVDAYEHYIKYNKVPLIIMDATQACYEGGPRPTNPSYRWKENAIYLAVDPVAMDQIAMQRIMLKRREMEMSDKSIMSVHISTAAERGLGTNKPDMIDFTTIRI